MLNFLKNTGESFVAQVFSSILHDAASACQIETIFDDETFVTRNGGLLSIIDVQGMRAMSGEYESEAIFQSIERNIAVAFSNAVHAVTFVFERDPASAYQDVRDAYSPTFATVKRLNLDLVDVLESDIDKLASMCARERCFIVISTAPRTLTKKQLTEAIKARDDRLLKMKFPPLWNAQNPFKVLDDLVYPHQAIIESIMADTVGRGLQLRKLPIDEAAFIIRHCIDEEWTDLKWRPTLPGGLPSSRERPEKRRDIMPMPKVPAAAGADKSHLLPSKLGYQLVPRDIEMSRRHVKVGSRYFAPMVMSEGPQTAEPFNTLFRRLLNSGIPWRISITLEPAGLDRLVFNKIYTSILGGFGEHNRRIRDAINGLKGLREDGDPDVAMRVNALTWAENPKDLDKRASILARAIQSWGVADVTDRTGDPIEAFLATIPGFTDRNPADTLVPPLSDAVDMLPFIRPASAWATGSMLYRTPDGKIYPVEPFPGSGVQDTWNTGIYAPPGSGKSLTMNSENLAFCLAGGLVDLPRLLILDIGPSSSGVISLLKDALPDERKHMVGYYKLSNTQACAINPFSTQLGCRFPTPRELSTQVNFLTLLMTPLGETKPYEMADKLAGLLLKEAYDLYSDRRRAKLYEPNMEKLVDDALASIGYVANDHTTWWQVVDALFERGLIHEASRAQAYAMPTLSDLMGVLGESSVTDAFNREGSAVQAGQGQKLVDAFATVISSALREYPILNGVTRFDTGDTRVLSLDLNDVAQGGDPASKARTALMYFLGYAFASRDFFLDDDVLRLAPVNYEKYHRSRIAEIRAIPKAVVMDEFHKTGGLEALRNEIKVLMREGRKWNIRVVLASQLLEDFDPDMIKLLTAIYVMKVSNQRDVLEAQSMFDLSDVAVTRIKNDLRGPQGAAGANFLAIFNTKKGKFAHILNNSVGSIKLWALTTNAEEMALRNRLYAAIGGRAARRLLADRFPGGASEEFRFRKEGLDEESQSGVVEQLANELIAAYQESRRSRRVA